MNASVLSDHLILATAPRGPETHMHGDSIEVIPDVRNLGGVGIASGCMAN